MRMSHRSALIVSFALAVLFALGVVYVERPDLLGRAAPAAAPPATAAAPPQPSRASAPTPRVVDIPIPSHPQTVAASGDTGAVPGERDHHNDHESDSHQEHGDD